MSVWRERLAELTGRKVLEPSFCQLTQLPKIPFVSNDSEQDELLGSVIDVEAVRPHQLDRAEDEGHNVRSTDALSVLSLAERWAQEDAANTSGPPYFVPLGGASR